LKVQYHFHCLIFTCETQGNEIMLDVLENRTGEIMLRVVENRTDEI